MQVVSIVATPLLAPRSALAAAALARDAPALFDAIAEQAIARTGEFTSQALCHVVWACATARRDLPRLFDAIAAEAIARLA